MQILFLFLWQVILIMELSQKEPIAIGKSISGNIKTISNSNISAISKISCNNINIS